MATIQWRDYDLVRSQLSLAQRDGRALFTPGSCILEDALNRGTYESPIEAVFAIWFRWIHAGAPPMEFFAFRLVPQKTIEVEGDVYRVDFSIEPQDPLMAMFGDLLKCPMRLAVELDGHEFHEKTKEQVAHRNQRDLVLQRHGWTVLHISGSELVRLQVEALKDVWLCAEGQLTRIREAIAEEWGVKIDKPRPPRVAET